MDATLDSTAAQTRNEYTSRPGALIWFFRKSRDHWKRKYQTLKVTVKGLKNRIADLTKSREHWRLHAEQASDQLAALEAENAALRAQIADVGEKKRISATVR
jgi:septal ring factor EnvC (AmiA/AmiB activator)